MIERRSWRSSSWGGKIAVMLAITTVLLFANTITVAPAFHDHAHDQHHDHDHHEHSHDCLVCMIATKGVWSPASAPEAPSVYSTENHALVLEHDQCHPAFDRLQPVRGPPSPA